MHKTDGNVYPIVTIGDQCWMAENLRTTRYRDGSSIPNLTDNAAWTQELMTNGAWCDYGNDASNDATYGKLYNWYAAGYSNICPLGWHVPTDAEWMTLESTLGMSGNELEAVLDPNRGVAQNVGGQLKATTSWDSPNTGATNASGFTALPGGYRDYFMGTFSSLGTFSYWWTTSLSDENRPLLRSMKNNSAGVERYDQNAHIGACVRCLLAGSVGVVEEQPARFTLAPNPTRNTVTIAFAASAQLQFAMLLDVTGREVSVQRMAATGAITFDLSESENGLYLLRLTFADGSQAVERVVKE